MQKKFGTEKSECMHWHMLDFFSNWKNKMARKFRHKCGDRKCNFDASAQLGAYLFMEHWSKVNFEYVFHFDYFILSWSAKVPRIRFYPYTGCLLYTSPSPRDRQKSRMPSSA